MLFVYIQLTKSNISFNLDQNLYLLTSVTAPSLMSFHLYRWHSCCLTRLNEEAISSPKVATSIKKSKCGLNCLDQNAEQLTCSSSFCFLQYNLLFCYSILNTVLTSPAQKVNVYSNEYTFAIKRFFTQESFSKLLLCPIKTLPHACASVLNLTFIF